MEVFDGLERHIQNPLVLRSILSLMEGGTLVLTTNYDNLLELFGQQQNKPMESLDLKDKTKVWPGAPGCGPGVVSAAGVGWGRVGAVRMKGAVSSPRSCPRRNTAGGP